MLTAIVGINWGDEGKGRFVDLLSADYDIVCRYQGGNNAGHTVINSRGKFILNLLPSGILRPDVVNVMGNGMVIDAEHLWGEMGRLRAAGVEIGPQNLKISDRAILCMPCHKQQDILEEERLADRAYGSTRSGIAPVYGDKYMKKALRMGDLLNPGYCRKRLESLMEFKSLVAQGVYHREALSVEEMWGWVEQFALPLTEYICDTGRYLEEQIEEGKDVMFEAQLGALRDIDFGIYPYTSSSNTIAAYAPIGTGIPGRRLDCTVGIMKAYSTCVGEGPFTCELFGDKAEELREAGGEYGAKTGRPRRVGPFDVPASRYGVRMQGADMLALTKMDVLSYLKEIPVCAGYSIDGKVTEEFPVGDALNRAKPVWETLPGWHCDLSGCKSPADLPKAALDYILYLEKQVGCPIRYVSFGPEREQYLEMK